MRVFVYFLGLTAVSAFRSSKQLAFSTRTSSSSDTAPTTEGITSSSRLQVLPSPDAFDHSFLSSTSAAAAVFANHFMNTASNLWVSTIDSDISKLSSNEFKPVFLGGLAIAFGGALSTVAVGWMIDNKEGGYTEILTESYLDVIENNPEFWSRLDEEETERAKEAIESIKARRGWGIGGGDKDVANEAIIKSGKEVVDKEEEELAKKEFEDIFNNY